MRVKEAGVFHKFQRFEKILLGFTGEPANKVRGKPRVREIAPDQLHAQNFFGVAVPAVHSRKHRVDPALERKVKMRHNLINARKFPTEILGKDRGFKRAETNS